MRIDLTEQILSILRGSRVPYTVPELRQALLGKEEIPHKDTLTEKVVEDTLHLMVSRYQVRCKDGEWQAVAKATKPANPQKTMF
jgi:hypothetical protein